MADQQLKTQLGFDASQAIASLNSLNAAMEKSAAAVKSFASSLSSFNSQGAQLQGTLKTIASSANSAASAMAKLQAAKLPSAPTASKLVDQYGQSLSSSTTVAGLAQIKAETDSTNASAKELTVSFGTIGRVLAVQATVRALNAVRDTLSESTQAALAYGKQLAEIETISDKSTGTMGEVSERIKAVSVAFNQPLSTTANAFYEALSNGYTSAADSTNVLVSSAKLATAGVAKLDDALNLVTSALNSYGLATEQADQVGAGFFRAVQDGRLRVDDIANSLGRVLPQAKSLGIGLDEVNASLATLTISGLKPAEAITSLRSAMNAFAKPSDAMHEAFKTLGVDSAEQLIAMKGWGGALAAVVAQSDKTAESIGRLSPNVRSLNTFLQIGAQRGEQYQKFLENQRSATPQLLNEKAGQVLGSNSQQVAQQLNAVKVQLTTGLGQGIVDVAAKIGQYVDVAKLMKDETAGLAAPLGAAALALTAYGTAAAGAAVKAKLFGASIPTIATALVGAGAAYSLGETLGDKITEWAHSGVTAMEQANAQELAEFKANQQKIIEAAQKTVSERVDAIQAASADVAKAYQKEADAAASANQKMLDSAKDAGSRIVSAHEQIVSGLGKAINDNEGLHKSSQRRVFDSLGAAADKSFSASLGRFNPIVQATQQIKRARELAAEAQEQLGKASNADQEQRALATFERAHKFQEQAQQGAGQLGNRFLQGQAAQAAQELYARQVAGEKQLQSLSGKRAASLEKERVAQQKILEDVKGAVKTIGETSSPLSENGELLSDEQLKAQAEKRAKAFKTLTDSALSSKNFDLTKALDLAKLNADLTKTPLTLKFDVEKGIADVKAKMEQAFAHFKLNFPGADVAGLEQALGKQFKTPTEVSQGIDEARDELNKSLAQIGEGPANDKAIEGLRKDLASILEESESVGRSMSRWASTPSFTGASKAFQTFRQDFAAVAKSSNVTGEDLGRLTKELGTWKTLTEKGNIGGLGPGNKLELENFSKGLGHLQQIQLLQHKQQQMPQATQRAQQLQQALGRGANVAPAFQRVASSINQAASASRNVASAWAQAAESAEAAAAAAARLNAPAPAHKATGGMIFRADGGFTPRGTDSVPAMLSPGEFVVNARSTRAFLPALQAMNAGLVPGHHAAGGMVNHNTSVGDIHIHADKNPHLTAAAVRQVLNRGRRTGQIKK